MLETSGIQTWDFILYQKKILHVSSKNSRMFLMNTVVMTFCRLRGTTVCVSPKTFNCIPFSGYSCIWLYLLDLGHP